MYLVELTTLDLFVEEARISLWDMLSPYSFPTSFYPCSMEQQVAATNLDQRILLASVCFCHGWISREKGCFVFFSG